MKRIHLLVISLLLAFVAQAVEYTPVTLPNPKVQDHSNYVANPDHIIASEEVLFLNRLARQLEDSTQVELCVVAVNSIGEMDAFDFCYELFQRWGIGKEGKNTGVLLFLAVESRDIRILTGGGIEGILTDALCNEIIQQTMMTPLRNADYSDAMALGAMRIYELCTNGEAPQELRQMTSATNRYHYATNTEAEHSILEWIIAIGVFVVILVLFSIVNFFPKKCPKCGKRGLVQKREKVIQRATMHREGTGVLVYCCKYCGHTDEKTYVIPRKTPTVIISGGGSRGGFGGGSIGGGFGGGSTFGGGAGGKF